MRQQIPLKTNCKHNIQIFSSLTKIYSCGKYGLTSQVNRASISISSNIAEGSSRRSEKDYHRFLEIDYIRFLF